ncbi:MAG TPA: class I SAM-dependent methyltransferase [Mycobacterium sp.]|nr:class I SAM-dependent methyltransferase [Mycobacterium sp.]
MSGRRVVDVGCGTSRLAAMLAALGANVIGIDLDAAMLLSHTVSGELCYS